MKKWIIVLVITNVITLLGFSITLTVLIMKNYLGTVKSAEEDIEKNSQADFELLKKQYEQAVTKNNTDKAETQKPEIGEKPAIEPKKETHVIKLTPAEYNNLKFTDRWRIVMMSYNPKNPDKSFAPLENILKESKMVSVGSIVESHEVTEMTTKAINFKAPDGKIVTLNINDEKIWAKYPIPEEKLINLKNKLSGKYPTDSNDENSQNNKNTENADNNSASNNNSSSDADAEGNVIILPDGVSKEDLPEDLIKNLNNPVKNNGNPKQETNPKNTEDYPRKYHFLAPKDVYKIYTKFPEVARQAVLENYYDEEQMAFAGVKIVNFDADSYFNKFGFEPGDIILKINDEKVETRIQLDYVIDSQNFSEGVDIHVKRKGEIIKFEFRFSYQAMLDYAAKLEGLLSEIPENKDFNENNDNKENNSEN